MIWWHLPDDEPLAVLLARQRRAELAQEILRTVLLAITAAIAWGLLP
jgi:hypothetical protein